MKATLRGAKLLKKPRQSITVHAASHLWCQEPPVEGDNDGDRDGAQMDDEKRESPDKGRRGKRCISPTRHAEEIVTVQLYCETLVRYLYYFDHGAPAAAPKYVASLAELIASSIHAIFSPACSTSYLYPSRRIIASPEMITRHFQKTIVYTCQDDVRESGSVRPN
ncbi:hypothetical protein EDD15DRAFT_344342 [Pisolithus albus]|nr:hypothetical protein EDD15DRAFT_344342 [Pisolithus albus]